MSEVIVIVCSVVMILTFFAFLWANQREWNRYNKEVADNRVKVKYHTAVHEAGHALAVLRSDRVKGRIQSVTTVPNDEYGGHVRFNVMGFPIFVQWERVIIALAGAAGEHVGKGDIDPKACDADFRDALKLANEIADSHKADAVTSVTVEMQKFYKVPLTPATRNILNFCMGQAVKRIRDNERDFYRLVDSLLERRELTGEQVLEVLSSK